MIIDEMATAIYVTGIVDGPKRLRPGRYEPSIGYQAFASTDATEFHVNRGLPSPKRKFRLSSTQLQEEFFKALEEAINNGKAFLSLLSSESGEAWQIEASSVRYEIRVMGKKEEDLTGLCGGELVAAGTPLGRLRVNLLESTNESVEAIVVEPEIGKLSNLHAALRRNEECRLNFGPPPPPPSSPS